MRLFYLLLLVGVALSQCDYTCLTCASPNTNCTSCVPLRTLTGELCPCIAGFYDSGVSTCSACSFTCLTCTTAATQCTTCPPTRTQSGATCPCTSGYYNTNTTTCPICSYSCLTCDVSADNCTSCPTTRTHNGTVCPCSTGFYETGVTTCPACNYTCTTCNVTATNCTSCHALRTLTTNTCPCNAGYYDNNVNLCAACNYVCATCVTSDTNCLSCGSTRTISGTTCPCNAGLYDSGVAVCTACNASCATCVTSATNCLTCPATRTITGTTCPCSTGYYDVGVATCSLCHFSCLTCVTSANNCTTCPATRLLQGNTCPCDAGFYENGVAACVACDYKCLRCTGAAATCSACTTTRALAGTNCDCITGYYDSGVANCSACSYTCLTCSAAAATCTSCNTTTRTLASGACPCNTGFYDVGITTCSACHYSCLTCVTSAANCVTCPATRTLNGTACPCNVGFYDNGVAACAVCNYTCLTCTGTATNCTSCGPNRALTNNTCPSVVGFFDAGVSVARVCDVSCRTCLGSSSLCTSCPVTRNMSAGSCVCKPGYVEVGANECASSSIDVGYGVLLTICWCLLADIAILFKHLYTVKYRILVHIILMCFAVFMSYAIMAAMIITRNAIVPELKQADFQAHVVIVYITIVWMSLQLIVGVVSRIFQASVFSNPVTLFWIRRVHRWSGYALMILCKINVILWWALTNYQIALGIIIADIVLILVLVAVYFFKYGRKMGLDQKAAGQALESKDEIVLVDPQIEELMSLPYNDPRVQRRWIVVFDDKVYPVNDPDFHPGGRKLMKLMNGREVDRFMYGISGPEQYAGLPPVQHPKNSMALLGAPIGMVPNNPSVTLPRCNFTTSSQLKITPTLSIFNFVPEGDEKITVSTDIKNTRHFGQYFAVNGFGQTRLYWCILSLLKGNRHLLNFVIDKKVSASQRLGRKWVDDADVNRELAEPVGEKGLVVFGAAKAIGEDHSLPLLITQEPVQGTFSQMLYTLPHTPIMIEGPKGRGLCLEGIPAGPIVVIASGTGIFPFLDLIDLIFKATIKHESM